MDILQILSEPKKYLEPLMKDAIKSGREAYRNGTGILTNPQMPDQVSKAMWEILFEIGFKIEAGGFHGEI